MLRSRQALTLFLSCTLSAFLLGGAAHAACDTLAFFPAVTNTYSLKSGAGSSTVTVSNRPSANSVTQVTTLDGRASQIVWTCTASGLSAELGSDLQMNAGFFPPLSMLKVGYRWSSQGQMSGGSGIKVRSTSASRIAGVERVTTPAGTFNTYRIETDTTTAMQLPAGSKLPPSMAKAMNQTMHSVAWYALGVGAVKQQMQDGKIDMLLVRTTK